MMKRRLAYIVLSIVLAFSALSLFSCGDDEIDLDNLELADDNTRAPVSLNFFIITDERTTDEAKQKMQDAFNAVSENEYRTHVEFVMCTAAEYAEMMEERFAAIESGEVQTPGEIDTTQGVVEYYQDELGQTKVKYPEIEDGQIDIVLVTGKAMLEDYVSKGRLLDLTEKLDGDFKMLRSYINTDLYNSVSLGGSWYSVPNNKVLGNYTYLFINKQIASDSYFNENDFRVTYGSYDRTAWNFNNIQKLLDATVKKNELKTNNPDDPRVTNYEYLLPLYSTFDFPTVEFWMEDGRKSIYATFYDANTQYGDRVTVINPFTNDPEKDDYQVAQSYVDYLELMLANRSEGYDQLPTTKDGEPIEVRDFAVAVMQGDYGLRHQYSDEYMVMILDNPRLEEEDMFASMLAVSSYTRQSDRALEIISDLTTKQELRNILLYGEEGTHYAYDEDRDGETVVRRVSNDYLMSLDHTGNAFMAYPCISDGQSASVWEEGMLQNNEALRLPTYSFTAKNMWETVETSLIDYQTILLLRPMLDKKDYQPGKGITDLELYIECLERLYFEQLFPELVAEMESETDDNNELNAAKAQVAAIVASRIDDLRVQAAAIAEGVVLDAKKYSDQFIARIDACEDVDDLSEAIEEICAEMASLPLFVNDDPSNGTPMGLYEEELVSRAPKFTLAGALLDWRVGVVYQ